MTLYTKEKDVLSLHVSQRVAELRKQSSSSIQRWIYMLVHVFSLSVITFCANFIPFIYITQLASFLSRQIYSLCFSFIKQILNEVNCGNLIGTPEHCPYCDRIESLRRKKKFLQFFFDSKHVYFMNL